MSIVKCIKNSKFNIEPNADSVIKFLKDKISSIQERAEKIGIVINATDISILQTKLKELQSAPVSQNNALQSAVVESLKFDKSFTQEPKKPVSAKTTKDNYKLLEDWSSPELFANNFSKSSLEDFLSNKINVDKDLVTKLYNIIAYQTASVDNANKNMLGDGNINAATFKFVMPALLQGLDMETIQAVIQSPIIKEYISTVSAKQSIGNPFTPDLKGDVILDIIGQRLSLSSENKETEDVVPPRALAAAYMKGRTKFSLTKLFNLTVSPDMTNIQEVDLLLAYEDYVTSHSEFNNMLKLSNIDSSGAGKSLLNMFNTLRSVEDIQQDLTYDTEEIFSNNNTNAYGGMLQNLRDIFSQFKIDDLTLLGRDDNIYQTLYDEFESVFGGYIDLNNSFIKENVSNKLEKFISAYIWNRALENYTGENVDFIRYSLIADNPFQKSLGTIIQEINGRNYHDIEYINSGVQEKDTNRNKNLNELINSTFFKSLQVRTPRKDYPNLKFVTRNNQDQGNYDPNLIHNEIAQLYQNQGNFVIGRINGKNYTTRNLIDDISSYALAVGATQSTNSLLNIVPSDILLDFANDIRAIDLSYSQPTTQSHYLLEFILNNPEILPATPSDVKFGAKKFKIPKDFNNSLYYSKGDDVYKIIQTGEQDITYGLMNPLKYKNYLKSYNTSHDLNATRGLLRLNTLDGNGPVSILNTLDTGYDVKANVNLPSFRSSGGALAWVYELANADINKDIAAGLMSEYGNIPIIIMSPEELGHEGASGRYYRREGVIGLSNKDSKLQSARTILHEVGHAATLNKIYQYDNHRLKNNKSTISSLSKVELESINIDTLTLEQISILDDLAKSYEILAIARPDLRAAYDFDEFVSEMLSNAATRNVINKLAAENKSLAKVVDNIFSNLVNLFRTILNLFTNKRPSKDYSASDKIIAGILFLTKTNNLTYNQVESGKRYNFTIIDEAIVKGVIQTIDGPNVTEQILANPRKAYETIQLDIVANTGKYETIETKSNIEQTQAISKNFLNIEGYIPLSDGPFLTKDQHNKLFQRLSDGDIKSLDSNFKELITIINGRYNKLLAQEGSIQAKLKDKSYTVKEIKEYSQKLKRIDAEIISTSEYLKQAVEAKKLSDVLSLATSQANEILELLDRPGYIPSDEQINYINDIVNDYAEFFDRNGAYSLLDENQYFNLNDASKIEYNEKLDKVKLLFETEISHKITVATNRWIQETVKREKGGKVYINVDEVLDDIGLLGEWTLSIDRTNEDLLSMIGLLKQKTVFAKDNKIRNKTKTLRALHLKALPYLSPKDSKFSHYTLFINEDEGTLVLDIDSKFHKEQTAYKEKIYRLERYQEEGRDVEDVLKETKQNYKDFKNKVYINLDPRYIIPREGSKIPQVTIDKKIQEYINILGKDVYDANVKKVEDNVAMYNRDYEAYKLELEESVLQVDGKIVNPQDKKDIDNKLSVFYKTYSPYNIGNTIDSGGVTMIDGKKISLDYKYTTSAVRRFDENGKETGYYNPKMIEIRKNKDLLNFHQELVKTFAEVRNNLPAYMKNSIRLSDIPYYEREFKVGLIKDIQESPTDVIRKARLKLVDYFVERIPEEAKSLSNNSIKSSVPRDTAANINQITEQRLIIEFSKNGISPDLIDKASTEYLAAKYRIREEVQAELSKFKSYDLLVIANLYYAASITTQMKENSIDQLAILRGKADKKFGKARKANNYIGDVKQSKSTTAPRKANLLNKDYSAWQGLSPRNPLRKLFPNKKQYNALEHVQKKYLEEVIAELEKVTITDKNRDYISNTLTQYKDDLDKLGGYIYFGNVLRVFNQITTYTILGYNISSFLPNKMIGLFNNIIEANDGRVFSKDTFNKIAKEIYFKSEITQFTAGVGGALLANILLPGAGVPFTLLKLLGGYGIIGGAAKKMIKPSPIASKLVKFMVESDILQRSQDEMRRSSNSIARSVSKKNWANKLGLGSMFNEAIDDPFIFTTKSEIPHQASMMGAVLEEFKFILDGKETTLLEQINDEGVLSNPDLIVNHPKIENIKVPISELLNEAVATGTALISRNHGNYRQEFKQLLKYSDTGTLVSTFKTWMFESYASRLEEEKPDWLIQSKNSTTHNVKGSYRSIVENSGVEGAVVALAGRTMSRAAINGTIGLAFGGPIGSLIGMAIAAASAGVSYYYLNDSNVKFNKTEGVSKTALQLYFAQLANIPKLAKYAEGRRKRANDKLEELLSPIDAANYRRVITERVLGTYLFAMYASIVIAKNLHDDDDDKELDAADKMIYFALNTTGRMMLDIDAYSSPGDAYSKVERLDRAAPAIRQANNIWKFGEAFVSMDRYERKEGRYEKGDYKMWKYFKDFVPWIRPVESVQKVIEQEFQIFNNK